MSAIDPFRKLVGAYDANEAALDAALEYIEELKKRLAVFEGGTPPPPDPPPDSPPSKVPLVPFTEPPLKRNVGTWDQSKDVEVFHGLHPKDTLRVSLAQKKAHPEGQVVRRDFGLQDPSFPPGGGAYLREPDNKMRRYEIKVKIPADYSGAGGLCTIGLKFHTHSAHDPAYLAWVIWTSTARWRVNHPDGAGRSDFPEDGEPIKKGHVYHLVVEAIWSQGSNGRLKAWTDGVLKLDHKGPNYSKKEAKPPYLLTAGCYFPSAKAVFSETFEFSELRVGDLT